MDAQHRFKDEWLTRLIKDIPSVGPEQLEVWRKEKRPYLAQVLVDKGAVTSGELMKLVEGAFRIPAFDPGEIQPDPHVTKLITEQVCRRFDILPVRSTERAVEVAMPNPVDVEALEHVSWSTGRETVPFYILPRHLEEALGKSYSPDAIIYDLTKKFGVTEEVEVLSVGGEDAGEREEEVKAPVVKLVNAVITDAVQRGASDIHIEHEDTNSLVRFRIDGHLKNILQLPRYLGTGPMVARIKIMANLDVTERFTPQDGRAKIRIGDGEVGLRVSTLPTRIGEKVVIRILDERASQVPFEALGFRPRIREALEELIQRDQGIVLVTGPTGSGKTTTLYSALNRVNAENINIITIEDPIEYRLSGISQVQVDERKGLTFPSVLRSVLRQDPDIVMVGEIRDRETAEIACQAALTGHLVFSTLHTNDTLSTITRLADMGVEGFKIAAGVLGITAQRLVRRLCPNCARQVDLESVHPGIRRGMMKQFTHPRVFEAQGCEACGFSGYRGRIGVVELLEITPRIRDAISQQESVEVLRRLALSSGSLHPLEDDIYHHLQEGDTTVEEVLPYLDFSEGLGDADSPGEAPQESPAPPGVLDPEQSPVDLSTIPDPAPDDAAERPKVLLAEADGAVRGPIADLLHDLGAQFTELRNGSEALQAAAKDAPDLILVGANLPGVDGPSLIQAVRQVLGLVDLPVLALVPGDAEEVIESFLEAGADDYIGIPLSPRLATARIRAALGRRESWLSPEEAMKPKTPLEEADRLKALRETGLVDTPPEERFDRITRKAQERFGVPVSYVAMVDEDRQWFKSKQGLEADETPRDIAFCAHTINEDDALVVPDSALDPRFAENPLALLPENHRFYAGVPLRSPEGQAVGTMCIVDHKPREMSEDDLEALKEMAREVEGEIWKKENDPGG